MHKNISRSKGSNLKRYDLLDLKLYFCVTLFFFSLSCAESAYEADSEEYNNGFGKADVSSGPIKTLSCQVENSFIRKGSFARIKVNALDAEGVASRNYELRPQPSVGTRVVQRNQIIFDLDGAYTVSVVRLTPMLVIK